MLLIQHLIFLLQLWLIQCAEVQQKVGIEGVEKMETIIQDENEELKKDIRSIKEQIIKLEEKITKK